MQVQITAAKFQFPIFSSFVDFYANRIYTLRQSLEYIFYGLRIHYRALHIKGIQTGGQHLAFLPADSSVIQINFVADHSDYYIFVRSFLNFCNPSGHCIERFPACDIEHNQSTCRVSIMAKFKRFYVCVMDLYCSWPAVSQIWILTLRLFSI